MYIYIYVYSHIYTWIYGHIYLSLGVSVCLSVCLSVYMSVWRRPPSDTKFRLLSKIITPPTPSKRQKVQTLGERSAHRAGDAHQATQSANCCQSSARCRRPPSDTEFRVFVNAQHTLNSSSWRRPPGDTKFSLVSNLRTLATPTRQQKVLTFGQRSAHHVGDAHQATQSESFAKAYHAADATHHIQPL